MIGNARRWIGCWTCIVYKVHKVYKVYKVHGPCGRIVYGSFAADKLCPKDSRDFMDFIDLMDFTDYKKVITSGPVLKRRSRMLRFGVKGKRSAKVWW